MANYLLAPTPRLAQKVTGDALQDESRSYENSSLWIPPS